MEKLVQNKAMLDAVRIVQDNPEVFSDNEKFAAWLQEGNWPIYAEFERRALDMIASGISHYGAKGIWETIRFHTTISGTSGKFKLNNNWHSPCARLFAMQHSAYTNFFEFRERPAHRSTQSDDAVEEHSQPSFA